MGLCYLSGGTCPCKGMALRFPGGSLPCFFNNWVELVLKNCLFYPITREVSRSVTVRIFRFITYFLHFFCEEQETFVSLFPLSQTIMEVVFEKEYLRAMYETGQCADKKHRYQPAIIRKYIQTINLMRKLHNVMGLCQYNSLRYEKLKGDKAGLSSVRVNDQYRIEFKEYTEDGETIATICNIVDLSNHYK